MPLSSYLGKSRRIGGAWAPSSFLPSSAKSKLQSSRKSRKRTALINFFFAHFITIAVSVSVLFFFLTIFIYGFKSKPSGPSHYGPIRPRRTAYRPRRVNQSGFGATVDITTKDLYDKIEFLDVDGGPWKQGWRVTYRGNEWDDEKLKVFVVPHSHNDPGWKLTVEEYYDRQSRHILDTIVETLSKDTRRKFIWEEMSYLERWWRDSPDTKRESFINLVNNGQLEIVGGGWVMNDEANSHFYSIIEQITEGNMWLNDTIGFIPRNSWAIDPFGYSPTMAYLLRRMGFENMLIQRTHYELKKELALHKNLEYIWRQSWDSDESTDIFVHTMPFYSYDIPHTCGPEPAICCQFDFARVRGFNYEFCPWNVDPVETTLDNVQDRALKLLDQYKKKSTLFRTNTLLIPLGDDFRYISIEEAEGQFRNYQMLFDYINSNPSLNTAINFGTLEDYFRTLREEADRVNYTRPGEIGSALVGGFPSLSGDFFTYADREKDYWSGYYVTRPFFKAVDRVLETTLRSTEMLMAFLLGYCQRTQCEKLPTGFSYKLTAARRNLALFQHHDGVTGTAKDHVVQDYGVRMHTSLQDLQIFMSKAIEVLLGIRHDKSDHSPSQFEPEQTRSKYDAVATHKVISAHDGAAHSVVFFNPLEQPRDEVVTVVVDRHDVVVLDSNWSCVPSQISPDLRHDKNKIFPGRHRLHWKASVPAMGLQTYYVTPGFVGCDKAKPARLRFSSGLVPCPVHYVCSEIGGDEVEIRNKHQTLTFDAKTGLLQKVARPGPDGSVHAIGEDISMYSSLGSGAYLFKPVGDAEPIIETGGGSLLVTEGILMKEVFLYPKTRWDWSPISRSVRIFNGGNTNTVQEHVVETEYHVEMKGHDFNDKELIVRFKTDIDNDRIFYSDLNGFQMARREYYDKIPLQGNYYPVPSLGFLHGSDGNRFSVHSRQSLGGASIKPGWLEIMLDRRLSRDDGRGLGQGITDNRAMNVVFHVAFESNVTSSASNPIPMSPSLLSQRIGAHLNHPLNAFVSKKPQETALRAPTKSFAPLASPLPCDLHIVSFKVPRPVKYSQQAFGSPRFALTVQRRHWDSSYCRRARSSCSIMADEPVNLFKIFKGLTVLNVRMTSLNLLHEDPEVLGYSEQFQEIPGGNLNISPMDIQAYKLEVRPHQ